MCVKGNVVKFKTHLYIVADVTSKNNVLEHAELISFDMSNSSTYVSRKNPFLMFVDDGNGGTIGIPDPNLSIDSIEVVAKSVRAYINERLRKLMFD